VKRTLTPGLILLILAAANPANAQPAAKLWRIGWLSAFAAPEEASWREAFRRGLQDHGLTEGQNVIVESRWAEGQYARLPDQAADLVRQRVDVIVAATTTPAQAAKNSTATIPIVFLIIADPVAQGLVTSLARPGGNATGLASTAGPELYGKMLELLKEVVPRLKRVALLWNPASPFGALFVREVGIAARSLGVEVKALEAPRPEAFEDAFRAAVRERVDGLVVTPDPMFIAQRVRLADLAARRRLPAVYGVRQHGEAGGLMVYTADRTDLYRRAGGYVAKILKGASPGDLPVERPTTFELIINAKTARALGLNLSPSLLLRANQVIE
jgi:ABC-type uncharacterized transport system substrate-binding protein